MTTTDEETRLVILTTRLTSILENKINYKSDSALEIKSKKAPFVKTKFVSSRNYLWERCSYFEETEEVFYVKLFLDSGKFLIGHQLFIDKTNEVCIFISFKFFVILQTIYVSLLKEKFASVELLNTQTAFLLADLNNQTQVKSFKTIHALKRERVRDFANFSDRSPYAA